MVGVDSDIYSAYFYHSCNNQRKCLDFRMFPRNSGLSELRKAACRKLICTAYLFHLLFYQCSFLFENKNWQWLSFPGGEVADRWEVRSWVRLKEGVEVGMG